MFPKDDICNVKAAKRAAQRIFEKYTTDVPQQKSNSGLGQSQVKNLIKNAYSAINMNYNPSNQDVFSFMSVFGIRQDGKIELNQLQKLAVKYLCGQQIPKQKDFNIQKKHEENPQKQRKISKQQDQHIGQKKTQSPQKIFLQNNQSKEVNQLNSKIRQNLKIDTSSQSKRTKNQLRNPNFFLSPKVTVNKDLYFKKQINQNNNKTLSNQKQKSQNSPLLNNQIFRKPTRSYILNEANIIFNQARIKNNGSKIGISKAQAKQVLQKSYRLLGKSKYRAQPQDVQIWMKLCDQKKNGIIEWVSYQNFIKRLMDRQNIPKQDQN